ncbi:MAG: hypothetical protein AAF616_15520 [Bacteroidota bacterium]
MELSQKIKSYRAHYWARYFWVSVFLSLINILPLKAHTIVMVQYELIEVDGNWTFYFRQKTNQLRNTIYDKRPELKGLNLNSEDFLNATAETIISSLQLFSDGNPIDLVPKTMEYGGLEFEAFFNVCGLPSKPQSLRIETSSFDEHEHSIAVMKVTQNNDSFLHFFNSKETAAIYDFSTRRYEIVQPEYAAIQTEVKSKSDNFIYYLLPLSLILIAGSWQLKKRFF